MNVVETIQQKIVHLPPRAQKEVLEIVEQIEQRYGKEEIAAEKNGAAVYPLTRIAELAVDVGVSDLAERHDLYAHGKLED